MYYLYICMWLDIYICTVITNYPLYSCFCLYWIHYTSFDHSTSTSWDFSSDKCLIFWSILKLDPKRAMRLLHVKDLLSWLFSPAPHKLNNGWVRGCQPSFSCNDAVVNLYFSTEAVCHKGTLDRMILLLDNIRSLNPGSWKKCVFLKSIELKKRI